MRDKVLASVQRLFPVLSAEILSQIIFSLKALHILILDTIPSFRIFSHTVFILIPDCSPSSRLSSSMRNDVYLPVRTSASNISVNGNRFSRHFVSSVPDLKLFTTTNV